MTGSGGGEERGVNRLEAKARGYVESDGGILDVAMRACSRTMLHLIHAAQTAPAIQQSAVLLARVVTVTDAAPVFQYGSPKNAKPPQSLEGKLTALIPSQQHDRVRDGCFFVHEPAHCNDQPVQ